jgi:hypothetical protein
MKKLLLSLAVVAMVAAVACNGGKEAREKAVKDSLLKDSIMKDSIKKVQDAEAAAAKMKADSAAKADSIKAAEEAAKKGGKKAKK